MIFELNGCGEIYRLKAIDTTTDEVAMSVVGSDYNELGEQRCRLACTG